MTTRDINILIERYFAGETTPEEERILAVEVTRQDAPAEWKAIASMLGELTLAEAQYDDIMRQRKATKCVPLIPERCKGMWVGWSVAASVAVVVVAGTLFFGSHSEGVDGSSIVAQVDSVMADTVAKKSEVQGKPMDEKDAVKTIRDIHRITNPQRVYIAQETEVEGLGESDEYGADYAEVNVPIMILDMDLDEFRDRAENLNEAVAAVSEDLFDEE